MDIRDISGVILAGGRGSRVGGTDKGLIDLAGQPMIAHTIERFAPQVSTLFINANRNTDRYVTFGYRVIEDSFGDYPGPLAGIGAGLAASETSFLAVAPCDSPFLPRDLVARLAGPLEQTGADISVALCGGRPQPVFILIARHLGDSISTFLASGGRKITQWYRQESHLEVEFGPDERVFANVNTPEDIVTAGKRLRAG